MISITTSTKTLKSGQVVITAKGKGKQRTMPFDNKRSMRANVGTAAGVVGNLILSPEQQAKVWHPSGRQRVTFLTFDDGTGRVNIDV